MWLDPTSRRLFGQGLTYYVSNAWVIYGDPISTVQELEPTPELEIEENPAVLRAKEHLECYDSLPQYWTNLHDSVGDHLNTIVTLWGDITKSLDQEVATRCPGLTEWHGVGTAPAEYYGRGNSLSFLWTSFITGANSGIGLTPVQNGGSFTVLDVLRCSSTQVADRYVQLLSDISANPTFLTRIRRINERKQELERSAEFVKAALVSIANQLDSGGDLECECKDCAARHARLHLLTSAAEQ